MTELVETNALMALLNGDQEEAEQLVKDEIGRIGRAALAKACQELASICLSRCEVCDEYMTAGDPRGWVASYPYGLSARRIQHHRDCPLPVVPRG